MGDIWIKCAIAINTALNVEGTAMLLCEVGVLGKVWFVVGCVTRSTHFYSPVLRDARGGVRMGSVWWRAVTVTGYGPVSAHVEAVKRERGLFRTVRVFLPQGVEWQPFRVSSVVTVMWHWATLLLAFEALWEKVWNIIPHFLNSPHFKSNKNV